MIDDTTQVKMDKAIERVADIILDRYNKGEVCLIYLNGALSELNKMRNFKVYATKKFN